MSNIAFVSLGCDKNLVDSEVMLGLTKAGGFNIVPDEADADIIVVNTCCFIKDALEESIEAVIEAAEYKKTGKCKGVIVAGCLGQRYEKEIFDELPEVDAVVGTAAYEDIAEVAARVLDGETHFRHINSIDSPADNAKSESRLLSSSGATAYLKIAEGCDNLCTYCVIPKLRGKYRSRAMESLVREAAALAKNGVKELILVAQDCAPYGIDLYGEKRLPQLLDALCCIDGLEWIRLLYCYPENITEELLDTMAAQKKVCKYIDMPLQHCMDGVLKRMGRKSSQAEIRSIVGLMRAKMPDIAIRTTMIAGFPGETDEDVSGLIDFIREMRFDRLGVFAYSQEDGTPAAALDGQLNEAVKEERRARIMEAQKEISSEKCQSFTGRRLTALIEGYIPEDGVYCSRTYRDAPDIDGMLFVSSPYELISGDFVDVDITGAGDYDLMGDVYDAFFTDESAE